LQPSITLPFAPDLQADLLDDHQHSCHQSETPQWNGTVWGGGEFELFGRLWADPKQVAAIELYGAPGLQLGFAGPDYYARRSDVWVGYGYAFGGSAAFVLRLPLGLRICWVQNLFDTFVQGTELLAFTPSVESLFELSIGVRIHW
jgi:hypothetical protein